MRFQTGVANLMSAPPLNHLERKTRDNLQRWLVLLGLGLFAVGVILPLVLGPHAAFSLVRWLGLAVIAAGGLRKSSLTYWIFSPCWPAVKLVSTGPTPPSTCASSATFFSASSP